MGKCKSFIKLIKLLWDNSDKILDVLDNIHHKIPLIVQALRNSANQLEEAATLIGSVEGEIGNTFKKVGVKLNNIKIPKFELRTDGFMNAFMKSIRSVIDIPIHEPPEEVKNNINSIRVLTMFNLDGQTSPFLDVINYMNLEGQTIIGVSDSSRKALHNTSKGFHEVANILEGLS
jgi:hypothetical protein